MIALDHVRDVVEDYLDQNGLDALPTVLSDVLDAFEVRRDGDDSWPSLPRPRHEGEAVLLAATIVEAVRAWREERDEEAHGECIRRGGLSFAECGDCSACAPYRLATDRHDARCSGCQAGRGAVVCQACQSAAIVGGLRASVREVA